MQPILNKKREPSNFLYVNLNRRFISYERRTRRGEKKKQKPSRDTNRRSNMGVVFCRPWRYRGGGGWWGRRRGHFGGHGYRRSVEPTGFPLVSQSSSSSSSSSSLSKTIVVIGGGIAGLTAAYELVLAGKTVVLLERDPRVGGNIKGITINGKFVDLGVLQLWRSWYTCACEITDRVGLAQDLKQVPPHDQRRLLIHTTGPGPGFLKQRAQSIDDLKRVYLEGPPQLSTTENNILSNLEETLVNKSTTHSEFAFYNPRPSKLVPYSESASDILQSVPTIQHYYATFLEGYLYPPLSEIPAYSVLGLITQDKTSECSFYGQTSKLPIALERKILAMGGRIIVNATVKSIDTRTQSIVYEVPRGADESGRIADESGSDIEERYNGGIPRGERLHQNRVLRQIDYSSVIMASPPTSILVDKRPHFSCIPFRT